MEKPRFEVSQNRQEYRRSLVALTLHYSRYEGISTDKGEEIRLMPKKEVASMQLERSPIIDIADIAQINYEIAAMVMRFLNTQVLPTAFIGDESELKVKKLAHIPIEVVVRDFAAGSYTQRHTAYPVGYKFPSRRIELFYKHPGHGDLLMDWNSQQKYFDLQSSDRLKRNYGHLYLEKILPANVSDKYEFILGELIEQSHLVKSVLTQLWNELRIEMPDIKLEFGLEVDENSDEVRVKLNCPIDNDTWRLWVDYNPEIMIDADCRSNSSYEQFLDEQGMTNDQEALKIFTELVKTRYESVLSMLKNKLTGNGFVLSNEKMLYLLNQAAEYRENYIGDTKISAVEADALEVELW